MTEYIGADELERDDEIVAAIKQEAHRVLRARQRKDLAPIPVTAWLVNNRQFDAIRRTVDRNGDIALIPSFTLFGVQGLVAGDDWPCPRTITDLRKAMP